MAQAFVPREIFWLSWPTRLGPNCDQSQKGHPYEIGQPFLVALFQLLNNHGNEKLLPIVWMIIMWKLPSRRPGKSWKLPSLEGECNNGKSDLKPSTASPEKNFKNQLAWEWKVLNFYKYTITFFICRFTIVINHFFFCFFTSFLCRSLILSNLFQNSSLDGKKKNLWANDYKNIPRVLVGIW